MTPIESVAEKYFPNVAIKSVVPVSGGLINQTFRTQLADDRTFIVQKVNTDVFKCLDDIHQNIYIVGKYLSSKPYPFEFPMPIKTKTGNTFIELDDEHWRILPFVKASYTVQKPTSLEMARNAGSSLAQFHASTIDLDSSRLAVTIPGFHMGELRINQFNGARAKCISENIDLVEEIQNHFHVLEKWDEILQSVPTRVAHFDTKIENFLFKNGTEEVAALIDLDTLMPGSILSDFGDLIRSFCDDRLGLPNLQFREALLIGYLSVMKGFLSNKEIASLRLSGSALTLMQALRFLTDHLNGDKYYQIEHNGQNLERARRQFSLYLQLV